MDIVERLGKLRGDFEKAAAIEAHEWGGPIPERMPALEMLDEAAAEITRLRDALRKNSDALAAFLAHPKISGCRPYGGGDLGDFIFANAEAAIAEALSLSHLWVRG